MQFSSDLPCGVRAIRQFIASGQSLRMNVSREADRAGETGRGTQARLLSTIARKARRGRVTLKNESSSDLPEQIGQYMVCSRSGTNLMEHEDYERRRRAELSGSIYSLLFLVIATFNLNPRAFSIYMTGLMRRQETGRWTTWLGHYEASLAAMFLVELAIVMCCYRFGPLRMTLREMGVSLKVPRLRELGWGFLSGLFVYAASLPVLFRFEPHSGVKLSQMRFSAIMEFVRSKYLLFHYAKDKSHFDRWVSATISLYHPG